MRFLHTADWHLGRVFHGNPLLVDQEHALQHIIDVVAAEQPDAVVVAGDIFDRAVPPPAAIALLDWWLSEIAIGLDTPVLMIAGNHDSPERLSFGERILRRGRVEVAARATSARTVFIESKTGEPAFVRLLPFAEPAHVQRALEVDEAFRTRCASLRFLPRTHADVIRALDLFASSAEPGAHGVESGLPVVVVSHGSVAGASDRASERPLWTQREDAISSTVFSGATYVALGHHHAPQSVEGERIRYSGSLLPYSFSETSDVKSTSIVEVSANKSVTLNVLTTPISRPLRIHEGTFSDLSMSAPATSGSSHPFVFLKIHGPKVDGDALDRLKERYPGLVRLEWQETLTPVEDRGRRVDVDEQSMASLFADFVEDVSARSVTSAERLYLDRLEMELRHTERHS